MAAKAPKKRTPRRDAHARRRTLWTVTTLLMLVSLVFSATSQSIAQENQRIRRGSAERIIGIAALIDAAAVMGLRDVNIESVVGHTAADGQSIGSLDVYVRVTRAMDPTSQLLTVKDMMRGAAMAGIQYSNGGDLGSSTHAAEDSLPRIRSARVTELMDAYFLNLHVATPRGSEWFTPQFEGEHPRKISMTLLEDEDGSATPKRTWLNADDLVMLTVDLAANGLALAPGDEASIELKSDATRTAHERLAVPGLLPAGGQVELDRAWEAFS